jgi:Uma2 family endonuclease
MVQAVDRARMTESDYLAFERAATDKHELFEGAVFSMAGGTLTHNTVVANVIVELAAATRGGACRPLASDMRVLTPSSRLYTYPDALLLCGRPQFGDERADTLLNPTAIFEVLSESTEKYDRGDKFARYREIPSLAHYVLVASKADRVEHFARQADGSWLLRIAGRGETVTLGDLATLRVDALYVGVAEAREDEARLAAQRTND